MRSRMRSLTWAANCVLIDWLARAQKLIKELPAAEATRDLLNIETGEQGRDPDVADQLENAETAKVEEKDAERKRRPSRDVHPAAIAWAALVIQSFAERIQASASRRQHRWICVWH